MASERQAYNSNTPWWGEHLHRYDVAIKTLKNKSAMPKSILDIACGNGFGSQMLAKEFNHADVIGGDLDPQAILDCNTFWKEDNLKFQELDGTQLPFEDNSIDMLCSFETIEHTVKYHEMLAEFSRVLSKTGLAFISTPNFIINSPSGVVTNPYHTQEFVLDELDAILKQHFTQVNMFGQQYSRYEHKANNFGALVEKTLYQRGVRKLPLKLQNKVMQWVNNSPMYPEVTDYDMVTSPADMVKCKTFFAICRND